MRKIFDYNISLIELQKYSDDDLKELLVVSQKDKDEVYRAACTYLMCIMESNRRINDEEPEWLDLKCIANIFDTEHEIIFRLGNKYRMYAMDDLMLVYNDRWVPYIFTIIEEDDKCIWKYFGMWKDN